MAIRDELHCKAFASRVFCCCLVWLRTLLSLGLHVRYNYGRFTFSDSLRPPANCSLEVRGQMIQFNRVTRRPRGVPSVIPAACDPLASVLGTNGELVRRCVLSNIAPAHRHVFEIASKNLIVVERIAVSKLQWGRDRSVSQKLVVHNLRRYCSQKAPADEEVFKPRTVKRRRQAIFE